MIKIDDIINAEFSRSFMGYDMKEVDSFLDAVIEQMESNEKERREMLTALEYLLHEIEQYEQLAADGERTDGNGRHASKRETQRAAELLRIAQETESPAAQSRSETAGTEAPGAARALKGTPRAGRQRTLHVRPEPENAAAMPDEPAQTADGEEIPTYTFAGLFADTAEEQESERIFVAEEYEIDEASPESQEPSKNGAAGGNAVRKRYGDGRGSRFCAARLGDSAHCSGGARGSRTFGRRRRTDAAT